VITRSSNNYGAFQFPEKLVPLTIVNAMADRRLPVYGDGRQRRDWLHVEDNCRALMAALEHGRVGEVYNIGSTEGVENLDLVTRLLKIMRKPDSLIDHVADRPGHDRRYAMNCSKAERELGWRPLITLESGLERTVRWYGENTDWLESVCCGEYRNYYERHYVHRESSLEAVMTPGSDAAKLQAVREHVEPGKPGPY
jgi:dTDP-glucose 4,6-dehydratase